MAADDEQSDEAFERYLEEVSRQPPLSVAEEARLAHLACRGDEQASSALVRSTLGLVVTLARRYAASGVSVRELVQAGNAGLVRAVEKFDPERGFRFSTYATWSIRQSMIEAIRGG